MRSFPSVLDFFRGGCEMIRLDSMLRKIGKKITGNETLVVLSDDQVLQEAASRITDELETGPPVLSNREGLSSAFRLLIRENRTPLVLLWSTDLEESGLDLEVIARTRFIDPGYVFGMPTLGLVSRYGPFWDRIPDGARAVYEERFRITAEEYIGGLRSGGLSINSSSVKGDIYSSLGRGEADIGIGMIGKGDLLSESGSWPLDRISSAEPVLARIRDMKSFPG